MDPYKVLNVNPKSFTMEEHKTKFKSLAVKYHPDINTTSGSAPVFQTISFCYKYLLDELETRKDQKDWSSLKRESKVTQKEISGQRSTTVQSGGSDFDIQKFNAAFEKYKKKR